MFATTAGALAGMLSRYTGKDEVVFGTLIAGREEVELESVAGLFINSLVLRIDASGNPTLADFVSRCAEMVRDALVH